MKLAAALAQRSDIDHRLAQLKERIKAPIRRMLNWWRARRRSAELKAEMPHTSKAEIIGSLRAMGIVPGDTVMLHSSLKSLGYVEGGPTAVLEALHEAISPGGTLVVPFLVWCNVPLRNAIGTSAAIGFPIAIGGTLGTITPATTSGAWAGAFAGVQWTDTTGRARVSNYWPASTAYQTGSCVAYFYNDPNIVYEIQADGSVAQTSIGADANLSNFAAGSNVTGLSQATLNHTTLSTGVQGQVQVLDIAPYPGNDWGDAYTIVRVQVARRQISAVVPGI